MSNLPTELIALRREESGRTQVCAPAVGWWSGHPALGAVVVTGGRIGELMILNRRVGLALPAGVSGRVAGGLPRDRRVAVAYGQRLFELTPMEAADGSSHATHATPAAVAVANGLAEGHGGIASPIHGVFYLRPSPDAPAFVAVGTTVTSGQAVGLVEAMKTFNQVIYGGPGLPPVAEVVEIRCRDGEEVEAGQWLLIVRAI